VQLSEERKKALLSPNKCVNRGQVGEGDASDERQEKILGLRFREMVACQKKSARGQVSEKLGQVEHEGIDGEEGREGGETVSRRSHLEGTYFRKFVERVGVRYEKLFTQARRGAILCEGRPPQASISWRGPHEIIL